MRHNVLFATAFATLVSTSTFAADLPGKGITVQPVQSTISEESFQTLLVSRALEKLGYTVNTPSEVDYNVGYTSIASGDATFTAVNWQPLHDDMYAAAGGDKKFYREGTFVTGAAQGYLIDKKTADQYHITNIEQLKDPKIARLFDTNGDGKADMMGCSPGWGCEAVINHQNKAFDLAKTVDVSHGNYSAMMADTIARAFNLSASSAGFIVTAAQLGYAAGLLFLVPLGDMFERRMLIVSMTLLAAGGMLITASSQSLTMMIIGTALTGLFSVVAQILVPLAATLASPEKRGKVVGTIMSGLLLGILLARTVAGLLASLGGWRTVYWVASVLMVVMALALWRGLPKVKQENHLNYPQLLASVFSLFTQDKLLRTRALLGCFTFANFSILWTSMAFLLAAPPFNYSEGVIGLFGLAGAAGALGARPAGGLADKGKSHLTTSAGLVLLLLSWAAIWYGHVSVLALIVGILVLDLTVQGVHITNQTVIYRVKPEARNRLTAGYMTSYFIGGAAGSLISASAWQHAGWSGVCAIGAIVATINLLVWWRGYHRQDAIH